MLFEASKRDVEPAEVLRQVKARESVYLCPFRNLPL